MISPHKMQILNNLKRDEDRLREIERLPPTTQAEYAPGISKLRQRIMEERHALCLAEWDTEAWVKHQLDDVDYYRLSNDVGRYVNRTLSEIEAAREAADLERMLRMQSQLEEYLREIDVPDEPNNDYGGRSDEKRIHTARKSNRQPNHEGAQTLWRYLDA